MKTHKNRKKPGRVLLVTFPWIVLLGILAACTTVLDDSAEPQVRVAGEGRVYISPAASPGVRDFYAADVFASVGDEVSYEEHEVRIEDETGVMVYLASSTGDFVPVSVSWDGRDSTGNFVDEGRYFLTITVTDDAGRSSVSEPVEIIVDNTPPEAETRLTYNVFSPDGVERTVLPILQSGSGAVQWSGSILDDERRLVRFWEWDADLPEEIEWDGRDEYGDQVEDGRYSYVLYGEDAAGNSVAITQDNIRVDTETSTASLSPNRRAFSPNDNGIRDTVTFETSVPDADEVIEWTFTVLDGDEEAVMTESGDEPLPDSLVFTGRSNGEVLPEDTYRGSLEVLFRNGETDEAISRPVTLDVTPPSVSVSLERDQFSPDGDEDYRRLEIAQDSDGAVHWTGRIVPDGKDESIVSRTWDDELSDTFSWNGQTGSGETAATGRYRYVLTARDRAGNRASVESESFLLDRDGPSLDVSISPRPFNPGAEDKKELLISVEASDRTGLDRWAVTIRDPEGNRFARLEGDGEPPEVITWDGRSEDGELPESLRDYSATVTVTSEVGNRSATERTVPIGLLVESDEAGEIRFRVTGIHFAPFEAEFIDLDDPDVIEQNQDTLDTIAEFLMEFPDQEVRIEGHAVHLFHTEDLATREQEDVLLPLSEDRAYAIRDALVERGIDEDRLSAEGLGGERPIVAHDDRENRWKNRRVEFVLAN